MITDSLALAAVSESLNNKGYATLRDVLSADDCKALIESYDMEALYRKRLT